MPKWIRALIWVDANPTYDAFLSYSWKSDSKVAPLLQSVLQRFLCPWYRLRAKTIFRDLSCLPAGSSLERELFDRLDRSRHLLVLASPEAAQSHGMELEARYWFGSPRQGQVLVVVSSGHYETWLEIREHLLPRSIRDNLVGEPLWIALQHRRDRIISDPRDPKLREQLIEDLKQVFLRLYPGQDWGQLRGEERSQRRRAIALMSGLSLILVVLAAAAVWFAFYAQRQRDQAVLEARIAYARQLTAQSELVRTEDATELPTAVRLASEALRRYVSAETDSVLWRGLQLFPQMIHQIAYGDLVSKIRYSSNGCCVLTSSIDGTARIIEVTTGKEVCRVNHPKPVWDVAIAPDGKEFATASADGSARIVKWGAVEAILTVKHNAGKGIRRVLFSPDGRLLATAGEDHTARLWDVQTGAELARIAHREIVWDIAFSRDGKYFASGARDGRVRVWDCAGSRLLANLSAKGDVWNVDFSPDGRLLAAGTESGIVSIWRTASFRRVAELHHAAQVRALGFSPDGTSLVTTSEDKFIRVWSLPDLREIRRLQTQDYIYSIGFSKDGSLLAVAEKTVRVWNLKNGQEISNIGLSSSSVALAFSPAGNDLATADGDKFLRTWSLTKGHRALITTRDRDPTKSAPIVNFGWSVSDDRKGRCIVTGSSAGRVDVFLASNGDPAEPSHTYRSAVLSTAVTRGCSVIAAGDEHGVIHYWHSAELHSERTLVHEGAVHSLEFNSSGNLLVSASHDGTACVWDVVRAKRISVLHHSKEVHAGFFLDDAGTRVLTVAPDFSAVWDTQSGKRIAILQDLASVTSVSQPADRSMFLTGGVDGYVKLWDSGTGRFISGFHTVQEVWGASVSPDGLFVATAPLRDRKATIWRLSTSQPMLDIHHPVKVSAVAFDPSGAFLATGGEDGSVRMWRLSDQQNVVNYQVPSKATVVGLRFTPDGSRLIIGFENGLTEVIPWRSDEALRIACIRVNLGIFRERFRTFVGPAFVEQACND